MKGIKESLRNPHTALRWANRLGLLGLAVIALCFVLVELMSAVLFYVLIAAGILLLAGAAVVELFFCRCPHCGSCVGWFRRRPYSRHLPEHCPRCGQPL